MISLPSVVLQSGTLDGIATRVAQDFGFFKKQGLKMELMKFGAGKDLDSLSKGKVDYGFISTPELAQLANEGVDICAIQNIASNSCRVMVNRKSSFKSLADLKGRTIGLVRWKCASSSSLQVLAKKRFNVTAKSDFKFKFAVTRKLIELLRADKVQAVVLWEPHIVNMMYPTKTTDFRPVFGPFVKLWRPHQRNAMMISILTTTQQNIENNKDEVIKVVKAYRDALRYIMSHSPEIVDRYSNQLGVHESSAKAELAKRFRDGSTFVSASNVLDFYSQYEFIAMAADMRVIVEKFPSRPLFYHVTNKNVLPVPFVLGRKH